MHPEKHFQKPNDPKNFFRKAYNKFIHKYMKFIPIIGVVILLALSFGLRENNLSSDQISEKISAKDKFLNVINGLANSFDFSDGLTLLVTIILLITIWTGYKYWLSRWRYLNKNSELLKKIIIVIMVIIFIDRHIDMNSLIGTYIDWFLFLLFFYLIAAGSWFLAKTIDRIDLSSDLYCWGLRIIGGIVVLFGILLLLSSTFVLTFSSSTLVLNNIYWIASISIILLGAFMGYRSFRRHPAIHVW